MNQQILDTEDTIKAEIISSGNLTVMYRQAIQWVQFQFSLPQATPHSSVIIKPLLWQV